MFFKSYILRQSTEGEGCAGAVFALSGAEAAEPPPPCADGAVLSVALALLAPRRSRARHSPPGPGALAAARARARPWGALREPGRAFGNAEFAPRAQANHPRRGRVCSGYKNTSAP